MQSFCVKICFEPTSRDIPEIRNHATILLTGGVVSEYNYDYRIAGVFAANALERMRDEIR
jgi:hypothetical protein